MESADPVRVDFAQAASITDTESGSSNDNHEGCVWVEQDSCEQKIAAVSGVKRHAVCDSPEAGHNLPSPPKQPKADEELQQVENDTENKAGLFQLDSAVDMGHESKSDETANVLLHKPANDETSDEDTTIEITNGGKKEAPVSPEMQVLPSNPVKMTSILPPIVQNGEALSGQVSVLFEQCSGAVTYPPYEQFQGALDAYTPAQMECLEGSHQYLPYNLDQYQSPTGSCMYTDTVRTLENLSASFPNTSDFNYALLDFSGLKNTSTNSTPGPDQAPLLEYSSHGAGHSPRNQAVGDIQPCNVNTAQSESPYDLSTDDYKNEEKVIMIEQNSNPVSANGYLLPHVTTCVLASPNSPHTQDTAKCQSGDLSMSTPPLANEASRPPGSGREVLGSGREVLSTWKIGKGPVSGDLQKTYTPVYTSQTPPLPESNERKVHIVNRPSSAGCASESGLINGHRITRLPLSPDESTIDQDRTKWTSAIKETNLMSLGDRIYSSAYTLKPMSISREAPRYQLRNLTNLSLNSSGSEEGCSPQEPPRLTYTPYNTPVEGMSTSNPITTIPGPDQLNAALLRAKENLNPDTSDMGRHAHNAKERARRARIKTACENLRDIIPGMNCKTDKATVFEFAVEYIKYLRHAAAGDRFRNDKDFLRQVSPYCE